MTLLLTALLVAATVVIGNDDARAASPAGRTEVVSRSTAGANATADSAEPAVSGDGRFVAFSSNATLDIVDAGSPPNPADNDSDIYVRDRSAGTTTLISRGRTGGPADGSSSNPSISADGRYVAFESAATNVAENDSDTTMDAIVCDRDPDNDRVFDERTAPGSQRCISVTRRPPGPRTTFAEDVHLGANSATLAYSEGQLNEGSAQVIAVTLIKDARGQLSVPGAQDFIAVTGIPMPAASGTLVGSRAPYVSPDGTHVVMEAWIATPGGDPNFPDDGIVDLDLRARTSTRVDVGADGSILAGLTYQPVAAVGAAVIAMSWRDDQSDAVQVLAVTRDPDGDGRLGPAPGEPVRVTVVSRDTSGAMANGIQPSLSDNGRYIAFLTAATGMHNGVDVPGEYPSLCLDGVLAVSLCDVVVRDLVDDHAREQQGLPRLPGELASPSVAASCLQPGQVGVCEANNSSESPVLSGDGRVVAFTSSATDLVTPNDNVVEGVFVRAFGPRLTTEDNALSFGNVAPNTSGTVAVMLTHTGFGPIRVVRAVASGGDAGDFSLGVGGTCLGTTLDAGESCLLILAFNAGASGSRSTTMQVFFDTSPTPLLLELHANVPRPGQPRIALGPAVLRMSTAQVNFGPQLVLGASRPVTVGIFNDGGSALKVTGASLNGDDGSGRRLFPSDYSLVGANCVDVVISPGKSCQLRLVHRPQGVGDRPAILRLDDDTPGGPRFILLAGSGISPKLQLNPGVSRDGRVSILNGTGFPAAKPISLRLAGTQPWTASTVTREDGSFSAPLLILDGQQPGTHVVEVRFDGVAPPLVIRTPIFVERGTLQPPDFRVRG